MILLEPQKTPYDLEFRLFGTLVRVNPMFWLLSAILGWRLVDAYGFEYLLAWIACVFVSILVHEFGHVWMGRAFGRYSHIVLYSFGGLAISTQHISVWWKRVLISFAGPLAGFALLLIVLAGVFVAEPGYFFFYSQIIIDLFRLPINLMSFAVVQERWPRIVEVTIEQFVFINLFWGLLNLLPIFPLDGGQISRDILTHFNRQRGLQISLGISFVVAALFAINAIMAKIGQPLLPFLPAGGWWMAILFGLLAVQSFMSMQQLSSGNYYDPNDPWGGQGRPWER